MSHRNTYLCTSQSPPRGITATTRRSALERALRRAHARDDDNSRRFDPTRARAANIGACIVDIMRRAVTWGAAQDLASGVHFVAFDGDFDARRARRTARATRARRGKISTRACARTRARGRSRIAVSSARTCRVRAFLCALFWPVTARTAAFARARASARRWTWRNRCVVTRCACVLSRLACCGCVRWRWCVLVLHRLS